MTPEPNEQIPPQTTALIIPEPPTQRAPLRDMLDLVRSAGPEYMQAFGRDLIEREVAVALYDQDARVARSFARSGFFGDITGATQEQAVAQAMTKIQLGRSWNMDPASAMKHLYFVNGKPAVENEYLASKMRDAGIDWDIEWMRDAAGVCTGCILWPRRLQVGPMGGAPVWSPIMERENGKQIPASVSFSKEDADRVKVKEGGTWISLSEKSTYKAYFQDMAYWKAIARLRRRYCTNVLSGIMSKDEAEEISPVEIQKALPAQKPMVVDEAVQPAREARKARGQKDIPGTVETVAAVVAPVPTVAPVVVEQEQPVTAAPVATEATVAPPTVDREAMLIKLRELRDEADKKGEGLFMAHLQDANKEMHAPTQLRDLSDADLKQHLGWLELRSKQAWRKNKDGFWVKGLF